MVDSQPDAVCLRRRRLSRGGARNPGDVRPPDSMTWQFYGGTLDPGKLTRESIMFAIACEPDKIWPR